MHYVITYLEYFGEENDDQVENEQDFEVHNFEDNQAEPLPDNYWLPDDIEMQGNLNQVDLENNKVEEETFLNRKRLNS